MKIWRYPFLIFSMFLFLEVFVLSGASDEIASINFSVFHFILIGFFLGFATGRIQLPLSILAPIYLVQFAISAMPILDFVFINTSIFLGYLITPIHPCVSYSTEYFETDLKKVLRILGIPTLISFLILVSIYWILCLI
jgi:hypothetical protein